MWPIRPTNFAACPAPTNKPIRGSPGIVSRMKFRSAVRSYTQVLLSSSGPTAPGRYLVRNRVTSAVCSGSGSYRRVCWVTNRPDMSRAAFTAASP